MPGGRQDRIRKINFALQNGLIKNRRPMTKEEIAKLMRAMETKRPGQFGVQFLSKVELNDFIPVNDESLSFYYELEPEATLLSYATYLCHDHITGKLVLSGANPTARFVFPILPRTVKGDEGEKEGGEERRQHGDGEGSGKKDCDTVIRLEDLAASSVSAEVREWCLQNERFYCVHVVNEAMEMRFYALTGEIKGRKRLWRGKGYKFPLPSWESPSSVLPWPEHCPVCDLPNLQPMRYLRCHHWICERCFWIAVCKQRERELCCVTCGEGETLESVREEEFREREGEQDLFSSLCGPITPSFRAKVAKHRIESLPKLNQLPKKEPFRARSLLEGKKSFLGAQEGTRNEVFQKAARTGDFCKMVYVLLAGVDVNAEDEYGQICLHLTTFENQFLTSYILMYWMGLSPLKAAAGGTTPLLIAISNGYHALAAGIAKYLACESHVNLTLSEICDLAEKDSLRFRELTSISLTQSPASSRTFERPQPRFQYQIPPDSKHPGAGAFTIDDGFPLPFLDSLVAMYHSLTDGPCKKASSNTRRFYSDTTGRVSNEIRSCMINANCKLPLRALSHMRFLCYSKKGAALAPHVDLTRALDDGRRSTHTFIIYLQTCERGGGTALLKRQETRGEGIDNEAWDKVMEEITIVRVKPRIGRLLVFPHFCPHAGLEVIDIPKLLIRGEMVRNDGGQKSG